MTTPAERLTNARFAKIAARLARSCAGWAADSLELPELCGQPIEREALRRFVTEIRNGLDYLEHLSRVPVAGVPE